MPSRTVQLKDNEGNNIFPLAGWIGDDTIKTDMIEDGAATSAKLADSSVTTAKINNGAVTTDKLANTSVTSSKIDWSTTQLGSLIFNGEDLRNDNGYVDNRNDGWSGFNFDHYSNIEGACSYYQGVWSKDGIGGGVKLTSSAPKGYYLLTIDVNAYEENAIDGYRPLRICKNSTELTGDVGFGYRGGNAAFTVITELSPNDIVNLQVWTHNSGRTIRLRSWWRGYFIRPS